MLKMNGKQILIRNPYLIVESDLELPMSEEQDYEADSESGEYEDESDGVITSSRCSSDEASEDEEHNVDEPGTPLQEESVIGRSVQSETGTELEEEEVSQSDDERDEMDLAPPWEMNFLRKGFKSQTYLSLMKIVLSLVAWMRTIVKKVNMIVKHFS